MFKNKTIHQKACIVLVLLIVVFATIITTANIFPTVMVVIVIGLVICMGIGAVYAMIYSIVLSFEI